MNCITRYRYWSKLSLAFVSIFLIAIMVLAGCNPSSTLPAPAPMSQGTFAFLPTSAHVNLTPFAEIEKFRNPKYTAATEDCTHASVALALSKGQTLSLVLESDCPIDWDGDFEHPRPAIAVTFAQMLSYDEEGNWTSICSSAKDVTQVSASNEGRRTEIILRTTETGGTNLAPPGEGIYKLLALNLDPNTSHYLKYSISSLTYPGPAPFITANIPTGPSTGEVGQPLTYLTSVSSNIAGSPEYRFDWGDGSYSSWLSSPSASHFWSKPGTYTIRAQARYPNIVSEWSNGKSVTISSLPSPNSGTSASLPISANVELARYSDVDKLDIPGYSAFTKGCAHASQAVPLAEGQTVTLFLESDCPINWYNPNSESPKPEMCVIFGEAWPDGTISTGAKRVNEVSFFNHGKAARVLLSPMPMHTKPPHRYRLIAWNHDPHDFHYLKYSIRNGVASPPATWTPSGPSLITLPRSPWNPEIMKFYITPDDPKVKATVDDILSKEQIGVFTDFEALRDWVAWHVSYRFDQDVHGVSDYWQLPAETLEIGTGDCEDFAILLCTLLRAYGVPADQVYVAVGITEDKTLAHGYLVEKRYQGIWRVTEPQAGAWRGVFLTDWYTSITYEELYCFNDQDYFKGPLLCHLEFTSLRLRVAFIP